MKKSCFSGANIANPRNTLADDKSIKWSNRELGRFWLAVSEAEILRSEGDIVIWKTLQPADVATEEWETWYSSLQKLWRKMEKCLMHNLRERELVVVIIEDLRDKEPNFTNTVSAVSSRLEKVIKLEESRPTTNQSVDTMTSFLTKRSQSDTSAININDVVAKKSKQVSIIRLQFEILTVELI